MNYFDPSGLLKALVVIFRNSEYGYVTGTFVVVGPPDPEEDSSGDGTGRSILFDVESAVKNLGKGCKKFFGDQFLSDAASFAKSLTVVDSRGAYGNNKIPGLDKTFAQFLDGAGSDVIAAVVRTTTGVHLPYIVIGANFAVPFQTGARGAFLAYYGNRLRDWQRDALFHEFMHALTKKDDMAMAAEWKKQGAELGDISTSRKASQEMFLFIARDCKKKK